MSNQASSLEVARDLPARSHKGGWLRWGCLVVLALVLLAAAVFLFAVFLLREGYRREIELARRAGEADAKALVAVAPIPDAENAAPLYLQAFALLPVQQPGVVTDGLPAFALDQTWAVELEKEPAAALAAREWVEQYRKALNLLHEGAKRPRCRFEKTLRPVPPAPFDGQAQPRMAARLMHVEARLLLLDGRRTEALRAIDDLYHFCDAARDDQYVDSCMVSLAVRGVAAGALRRALQEPLDDAESLRSLAGTLDATRDATQYARAQRAGWTQYGRASTEEVKVSWRAFGVTGKHWTPRQVWAYGLLDWVYNEDMTHYLSQKRRLAEFAGLPFWEAQDAEAKIEREAEALPFRDVYARRWRISALIQHRAWATDQARHDGARLAVALARCRLSRGACPAKLDDLVPEFLPVLPLDPFTGKPFLYRTAGDSARVYSLAQVGVDLGGGTTGADDMGNILFPLGDQSPFEGK